MTSTDSEATSGVPRRRVLLGGAGGVTLGALAAGGTAWGISSRGGSTPPADAGRDLVDLTGQHGFLDQPHPPGVATPPQRHAVYMTFDLADGSTTSDLQTLLARWSAAISLLMAGRPIGQIRPAGEQAVGQDTGEAAGLDPAGLTVTLGLGPDLFDRRFGLAAKKPALLQALPHLPSDNLAAGTTEGDLSLQVCSDDPQVSYHAVRNLARMARDVVRTRWTVIGFGRASAGSGQQTPRNLFGFKDGTRNVQLAADVDRHVWLRDAGWMTGGTYQVVRKIEMNIETWDADRVSDQEQIVGRTKLEGAPLSGRQERDVPDFTATGNGGQRLIDVQSHVALAAPENNGGIRILRRGYNYTDGINEFGQLDAGLLFIAYLNDTAHFVHLQTRLGAADQLNEYISHVGSGVFAVPPAPALGHYLAEQLFT